MMLYEVKSDTGKTEEVDLDGDGIFETRRPEIKILTIEAATGDEAAAKAMTMGARFVRGVEPAKAQPAPEASVVPVSAAADLLVRADGMHVKTLQAAASKILGDDTPSSKAEIIAALHAKAA